MKLVFARKIKKLEISKKTSLYLLEYFYMHQASNNHRYTVMKQFVAKRNTNFERVITLFYIYVLEYFIFLNV